MSTEKKLSPEQAAINAALVAMFIAPARVIARKANAIESAKGDTWGAFKDAARIGQEHGHDVATMAKGISLACASVSVPQGTVNAYLPILRKLYSELTAKNDDGSAKLDEAAQAALLTLSIKDARAKYQPKKEKPEPAKKVEAGKVEGGEPAGDGSAGDADGVMGGTERSRLLSRINALLATLSDADLVDFLALLEPVVEEQKMPNPEAQAA